MGVASGFTFRTELIIFYSLFLFGKLLPAMSFGAYRGVADSESEQLASDEPTHQTLIRACWSSKSVRSLLLLVRDSMQSTAAQDGSALSYAAVTADLFGYT